jgi:hypothetical protein
MYNLPDPEYYLDNPKTKDKKAVDNINKERNSKLLVRTHNFNGFIPPGIEIPEFRRLHPLLKVKCSSSIEISRISPKLKMISKRENS